MVLLSSSNTSLGSIQSHASKIRIICRQSIAKARIALQPAIGWAGLLYLVALPALIARDIWQSAHRCTGHPCGIYQDTALKSPQKSRPHINLGRAYFQRGQFDLALEEFQQAELVSFEEPPATQ